MTRSATPSPFVLLSLISIALMAAGCRSSVPTPGRSLDSLSHPDGAHHSQKVSFADPHLQTALTTLPPTRVRSGGHLRVDVPIQNTTTQPIAFDYALRFVDGAGNPLDPEPDWKAALLSAHELVSLVDQTSDPRAQHFQLVIRASSWVAAHE